MNEFVKEKIIKSLITILLITLSAGSIIGQETDYSINGVIKDEFDELIPIGNVLILNLNDSSLITGAAFYDGVFSVDKIVYSKVLLKVTALGYIDFVKTLDMASPSSLSSISIVLKGLSLKEFNVIDYTPNFEHTGSNIKLNIVGSMLEGVGDAIDILRNSPDVVVSGNNNIEILGKGTPSIYVDGVLVPSTDILKSISSSNVESVNIIRNPSAKHEGGNNAVIEIILKKKTLDGYSLNIRNSLVLGRFINESPAIQFNFMKKRLTANVGLVSSSSRNGVDLKYNRIITIDSNIYSLQNDIIDRDNLYWNSGSMGFNYRLDSTSSIGFQINGGKAVKNNSIYNTTMYLKYNNQSPTKIEIEASDQEDYYYHFYNLSYLKDYNKGAELSLSALYKSDNTNYYLIRNVGKGVGGGQVKSINESTTNVALYALNLDFVQPIDSTSKLSLGSKYMMWFSDYWTRLTNFDTFPTVITSRAIEQLVSFYVQYEKIYKMVNFNFGFRAEYNQLENKNLFTNDIVNRYGRWNLLPIIAIEYKFKNQHSVGFYLSRKSVRPNFWVLNPNVIIMDTLSRDVGNPDLNPASRYSAAIQYNMTKHGSIGMEYNHTFNEIAYSKNTIIENNLFIDKVINIDSYQNINLFYQVNIQPKKYQWITSYHKLSYVYNKYKLELFTKDYVNEKDGVTYYTKNSLKTIKDVWIDVSYFYRGSYADNLAVTKGYSNLRLGVSRKFFKNSLNIGFVANDVFNDLPSSDRYPILEENEASFIRHFNNYTRNYEITLNWNFIKNKVKNIKDFSTDEELNR